ncbi:MAG: asparagine synthase (glutamine-hydrolyzing) [bacterium]
MCGILGIVANESIKYKEIIDLMISKQKHRGPDENNSTFFKNCALGHNRLSIVDLSSGQQPMYSSDSKKAIVFNGEIYGFEDIRKSLTYDFKTKSDTEIILALYEKYGQDLFQHLPGMFSFAIWDDIKQELTCGRDRFGEKPFYYAISQNGEFVFASEIKTIIESGLVKPILDKNSLIHYLKYLYIAPDKTIYKNIFTLPPAHNLLFKDGKVSIKRYWSLPNIDEKIKIEDAIDKFRDLLNSSVKKQLIADVPVGAFLSGGLDSTTIVALASKIKEKIKTFSFGFGSSINELPFAKESAKKYNTEHTELFADEDIGKLLMDMGDIYDEPFADSSNIPTYLISREARKYVTVVLTGDGGDELFGGYGWYKNFLLYKHGGNKHDSKFTFLFWKLAHKIIPSLEGRYVKSKTSYLSSIYKNPADFHKSLNTYFTDDELQKICLFESREKVGELGLEKHTDPTHYDLIDYMPGDILTKIDRASMANSIELRAPFLDVDFASFCASLPLDFKVSKEEDKIILHKAFEQIWPDSIKNRTKQGFGAPVKEWLALPSVIKIKNEYLNNPDKKIFKLISFKDSRKFVNKDNYRTWILLVLSIWAEKHNYILENEL